MIAIINGKVMTITQGTLGPGMVLIEGGRLVAVGRLAYRREEGDGQL